MQPSKHSLKANAKTVGYQNCLTLHRNQISQHCCVLDNDVLILLSSNKVINNDKFKEAYAAQAASRVLYKNIL